MSTHVVVISTPNPDKAEGAKKYAEAVGPLLKAAGVEIKLRGPVVENLAGGKTPATVLAIEFPDPDAAKSFFDQQAYQDLIQLREDSFSQMEIYVLSA
jgi:uncharacterized protein (DUF1330 family)